MGHVTYGSISLDKANTMIPLSRFSHHPVRIVIGLKVIFSLSWRHRGFRWRCTGYRNSLINICTGSFGSLGYLEMAQVLA